MKSNVKEPTSFPGLLLAFWHWGGAVFPRRPNGKKRKEALVTRLECPYPCVAINLASESLFLVPNAEVFLHCCSYSCVAANLASNYLLPLRATVLF